MCKVDSDVVEHIKSDMVFLSKLSPLIPDGMICSVVDDMVSNIGKESMNDLVSKMGITDKDFVSPMNTYMLKDLLRDVSKRPSKKSAIELYTFCSNYLYANIGFLLGNKLLLEADDGYLSISDIVSQTLIDDLFA